MSSGAISTNATEPLAGGGQLLKPVIVFDSRRFCLSFLGHNFYSQIDTAQSLDLGLSILLGNTGRY